MNEGGNGNEVDLGVGGVGPGTIIGEGGSARVYRAHQAHLDRDVAVKIIAARGDEAIQRRFERERRAMGRLSSVPGILTVFDAGVTDAGDLYLVMPLEEGGSLRDRIEQHGAVPWDEACRIMEEVAEAIEAAHAKGIVHRDLKPGNILVSSSGRPLVADFGIARLMVDGGAAATATGFAFTPAYSPPEAFETTESGPAIDTYGMGATLWALVAGRAPFTEADAPTPLGAILARIAGQRPGDLSALAPDGVCAVIDRAMAKEAAGRQRSAGEFASDLRAARRTAGDFRPTPGAVVRATRPMVDPSTGSSATDSVHASPTVAAPAVAQPVPPTERVDAVGHLPASTGSVPSPAAGAAAPGRPRWLAAFAAVLVVAGVAVWALGGFGGDGPGGDDSGGDESGGETSTAAAEQVEEARAGEPEAAGDDGGAPESSDDDGADAENGVEPASEEGDGLEPIAIPTPTPDAGELLSSRGFTDPSGAPTVMCPSTEESEIRTVVTATGSSLNVRSAPGRNNEVVLELADGHPVQVLLASGLVDDGNGARWILVVLPTDDGSLVDCGWVDTRFISSPTSGNLAEELRPREPVGTVSPGSFLSSCRPGWDTLLFGTTVDGRFDISVCTDGAGGLEYHGTTTATGDDIRLAACEAAPGFYVAMNAGFEYVVADNRTFGGDSVLEVIGGDGYVSVLTGVGGSGPAVGLRSC